MRRWHAAVLEVDGIFRFATQTFMRRSGFAHETEAMSRAQLLESSHPFMRATERCHRARTQLLCGVALLAATGLAARGPARPAELAVAGVICAFLGVLALAARANQRERVIELIIAGREDLPLAELEPVRRRLQDPRRRAALASSLQRCLRSADRWDRDPPALSACRQRPPAVAVPERCDRPPAPALQGHLAPCPRRRTVRAAARGWDELTALWQRRRRPPTRARTDPIHARGAVARPSCGSISTCIRSRLSPTRHCRS